jgi:hypothetical protein
MIDEKKTKPQLISELHELRRKVAQMEAAATLQKSQTPLRMLAETAASAIFVSQTRSSNILTRPHRSLSAIPAELPRRTSGILYIPNTVSQ